MKIKAVWVAGMLMLCGCAGSRVRPEYVIYQRQGNGGYLPEYIVVKERKRHFYRENGYGVIKEHFDRQRRVFKSIYTTTDSEGNFITVYP